jgi:CheY-like chemotaxis protein
MDNPPVILIVDDEAYFREIFSKKLEAEGYAIETAENGNEGIEKVKKLRPDLVLMDVRMPVMDGVATLMKIKEDPETKDIKIAFLTSFGSPEEEVHNLNIRYSQELGAVGFIKKTEDLENLVSKVKSFISPISPLK